MGVRVQLRIWTGRCQFCESFSIWIRIGSIGDRQGGGNQGNGSGKSESLSLIVEEDSELAPFEWFAAEPLKHISNLLGPGSAREVMRLIANELFRL